eukprot:CAMPEP_0177642958 /NCGR_PEP_ID=MMETSP0447-20121125/7897_1 /TAXON_ID=0 /ORGANISM="Stygamoeba regulata, Strain BSH-02190019" /LENGTH=50 /DNA_ID=CAMNT_0019145217 /DNA_START=252 /DNA_END=404 /DNA_ORIENTATION=-
MCIAALTKQEGQEKWHPDDCTAIQTGPSSKHLKKASNEAASSNIVDFFAL